MTEYYGLTMDEAKIRIEAYGYNEIRTSKKKTLLKQIKHILSEPVYLFLSCIAILYFLLGEPADGAIMIAFVIFVIGIDVFQEVRTGNALRKLKEITEPKITAIRDGKEVQIKARELVPGDLFLIREGVKIPADGYLLKANGLCVDESILTGEEEAVWKNERVIKPLDKSDGKDIFSKKDYCYTGTFVINGSGIVCAEKTGNDTEYGKIAENISNTPDIRTGLQLQMKKLAKQCTVFAAALFFLVGFFTFLNLSECTMIERIINGILAGVVLALSMIPGEFPVILAVFLSMGALRLAKKNALIRHLPSVETLGSVSVLCLDKTGTITQNNMRVSDYYINELPEGKFCRTVTFACKEGTYDPVEKAMAAFREHLCSQCGKQSGEVKACGTINASPLLIKEYPFSGDLKAMALIWKENGFYIIAAKGSPETILTLCHLSKDQEIKAEGLLKDYLKKGLRVIAVADQIIPADLTIPDQLSVCDLQFRGIIGLSNPVRNEIMDSIKTCNDAGIRVIMITGDHPTTAAVIADEVGIRNCNRVMTGNEINELADAELRAAVNVCNIFARVLPLHKMRIVKALRENGEVVAMTGDGVNDSPAQKTADIGISMGKHGSEVCREAADLILLDDNISTIINTVRDGRRIYQNIVKAVGYVLAIHIPIAMISLTAPMLGILPQDVMLLPLHIVLLELIMDPTCSIALERLPAENNIMKRPPRNPMEQLFTKAGLWKSILQGLAIFIFAFGIYYVMLCLSYPAELARTAGFAVLVLSNVLLVAENCSEAENIIQAFRKLRKNRGIWIVNIITVSGLLLLIYSPLNKSLGFQPLSLPNMIIVIMLSVVSVFWYETVKKQKNSLKPNKRLHYLR
jgi:Ca2+-transporting ATPase